MQSRRSRTSGGRRVDDSFNWLDVQRIGEELAEAHPEADPLTVTFPGPRSMVQALEGFQEDPHHPCNERILESIQQHWIDESDDVSSGQ